MKKVSIKLLNLQKNASQNNENCDMEIEDARITFDSFLLLSFAAIAVGKTDENGLSRPNEPFRKYEGADGMEAFIKEFSRTVTVFRFEPTESNGWKLSASADDPYFEVAFSFDRVTVGWNSLIRPAWYVRT